MKLWLGLILASFVLVVLKALGPLAIVPIWVCLLPLAPLAFTLVLIVLAAILALVIAFRTALKTPLVIPTA